MIKLLLTLNGTGLGFWRLLLTVRNAPTAGIFMWFLISPASDGTRNTRLTHYPDGILVFLSPVSLRGSHEKAGIIKK